MMFFYDSYYWILVLPALLIAIGAQVWVKSTFSKYSRMSLQSGMTGVAACTAIQQQHGIQVPIQPVGGNLSDHYDPRQNVIRLSESVYGVSSAAAVGVAAHETGHALQYAQGYTPMRLRGAILPVTRVASGAAPWLFLAGLILGWGGLAYLGLAFFAGAMVFQLLTLPVEFNASRRAMAALREGGMLTEQELAGARKVLTAAALTYVAALLVSLMSFLRMLLILQGRRRR